MTDVTHKDIHDRLVAPLTEVARRRMRRDLVLALLAGLVTGLAGLLFTRLVGGEALPVIALALAWIALGFGFTRAMLRRRGLRQLAFEVDRAAGLGQSFGTAVELSGPDRLMGRAAPDLPDTNATARDYPVVRALLRDAAEGARNIAPAQLEPLVTRPVVISAALAVVLGAAFVFVQVGGGTQLPVPAQVASTVEDDMSIEDALAAAAAAADRIAQDAEAMDDPYLEAVARAMRDLTERDPAEQDVAALNEAVQELLEHASRAYGEDMPSWLDDTQMAGLGTRIAEFEDQEAARQAAAEARAAAREALGPGMYDRDERQAERVAGRDQDELIAGSAASEESRVSRGDFPDETPSGGGDGLRPLLPEELVSAGQVPVGAALQSGRGQSNMAGLGSESLEEDTAFSDLAGAGSESVVVSATPQAAGNRIRIETAPEASSDTTPGALSAGLDRGGVGAAQEPVPPTRDFVPADRLTLVARYLARAPQ